MAALTLLQRRNKTLGIVDPAQSLAAGLGYNPAHPIALSFDAIPTESNENENIGSTNPIEIGSFVSDHIRTMPEKGSFTAVISQASLKSFFGIDVGGVVNGLFGTNLVSSRGTVLAFSLDPVSDAYNYIHDNIFKAKAIFDFVSGLKVYQTYFMSSFKVNRDPTTGMALSCSFTIEELIIVSTQVVKSPHVPTTPNPTAPSSATPQTDLGRQTTTDATPSAQAQNTQTLDDFSPLLGKTVGQ